MAGPTQISLQKSRHNAIEAGTKITIDYSKPSLGSALNTVNLHGENPCNQHTTVAAHDHRTTAETPMFILDEKYNMSSPLAFSVNNSLERAHTSESKARTFVNGFFSQNL